MLPVLFWEVLVFGREAHFITQGISRAASFTVKNSFVGTSHWLVTWTALSP
jgi:hypothetical protein